MKELLQLVEHGNSQCKGKHRLCWGLAFDQVCDLDFHEYFQQLQPQQRKRPLRLRKKKRPSNNSARVQIFGLGANLILIWIFQDDLLCKILLVASFYIQAQISQNWAENLTKKSQHHVALKKTSPPCSFTPQKPLDNYINSVFAENLETIFPTPKWSEPHQNIQVEEWAWYKLRWRSIESNPDIAAWHTEIGWGHHDLLCGMGLVPFLQGRLYSRSRCNYNPANRAWQV